MHDGELSAASAWKIVKSYSGLDVFWETGALLVTETLLLIHILLCILFERPRQFPENLSLHNP
jgi:hypothetical protein